MFILLVIFVYFTDDLVWLLQKSAVQISNVLYQDISGTSASDVAVKFDCSETFPCQDIELEDIDLRSEGGGDAEALCNNVKLSYFGNVSPSCCS